MSSIDKQHIRDILTIIAKVSRGDYDARIESTGKHTDFDSIASGLNMMINEIRLRQEDLEEQREEIHALNNSLIKQAKIRKQAENLYKTLTENSTTGIYITQYGKFVFFNEIFRKYCGYEEEELLKMDSIDLIHPDDREGAREKAIEMLKGERNQGYEFRIVRKNGDILWAMENVVSIEYEGDRAVLGNFVDITRRKQNEETLTFSDTILKSIHESILAMDTSFTITYWNQASEDMFGIKSSDAVGKYIGDLIHIVEQQEGMNQEGLESLVASGFNREELLYITPKGEIWVDAHAQVIEKDGERIGWVTLATDITERKKMEAMIRENEEKYTTVFYRNPMPMMILSIDSGEIVDVNLAFERINEFNRDEIIGQTADSLNMFVHPEKSEAMKEIMRREGSVDNFEVEMRNGKGEIRTILLSSGIIAIGGVNYLIYASNDITEQKEIERQIQENSQRLDEQNYKLKAQAQLLIEQREEVLEKNREVERANQLKSEFLASMSHELRTPLNAVIGFSELMLDGVTGETTEEQQECLNDILNSGKHLLELINDVLDLSKVEVGKMEFKPIELEIQEEITEAVQTVRSLLDQKQHTVTVDIEEGIRHVFADKSRLRQVLLNLLSNATKFTPQGGKIDITAQTKENMCRISVKDNGIGVKPEDQEKIFEVFTQAETIENETPKGTGLGLTLTKQFLIAMGGNIWVESEYGKGSTFYFTLPFADKKGSEDGTDEGNNSVSHNKAAGFGTVLIIDDDQRARRIQQAWLNDEGFTVSEAKNARDGLKRAEEIQPDVIILDILMPDKDGWYVLRKLKTNPKTAKIPVVIASIGEEQEMAFSLGAVDYFNKPIDRNRFKNRIIELGLKKHDTVLVVDDNPADIRLVSSILEAEDIEVIKATGGKTAIDIILRNRPDLIVLDIMMPDLTGFEVIEKLRTTDNMNGIPIIVMTSKDLSGDEIKYLTEQTAGIVRKSTFSKDEFVDIVKNLIEENKGNL